jgi:uncharacterized protein (DUF4415 family)
LTAPRPIKPTSPRCHSAWQPNPGRGSTYRRGKSVQTTGTTSLVSLRIDRDILDHFQEAGPGWQERINEALRKVIGK